MSPFQLDPTWRMSPQPCSNGPQKVSQWRWKGLVFIEVQIRYLGNVTSNINRLSENPTIYR